MKQRIGQIWRNGFAAYLLLAGLGSLFLWIAALRVVNPAVQKANEQVLLHGARTLAHDIESAKGRNLDARLQRWSGTAGQWVVVVRRSVVASDDRAGRGATASLGSGSPTPTGTRAPPSVERWSGSTDSSTSGLARASTPGSADVSSSPRSVVAPLYLVASSSKALAKGPLRRSGRDVASRRLAKAMYDRSTSAWAARFSKTPFVWWSSRPGHSERVGCAIVLSVPGWQSAGASDAILLLQAKPAVGGYVWPSGLWLLILILPGLALIAWLWKPRGRQEVGTWAAGLLFWLGTSLWFSGVARSALHPAQHWSTAHLLGQGAAHLFAGWTLVVVVLLLVVTLLVLVGRHLGWGRRTSRNFREHHVAYLYVTPAVLGMLVLVLVPFIFGLTLGFFNHCEGKFQFVGLHNFIEILSGGGAPLTHPINFYFTLGVTILWTTVNVMLHTSIGLALALLLRDPLLRFKGIYRMLLIIPWAIPNYITALMWKGMFHQQYGAVNQVLRLIGLSPVSWFSSFWTAFTANVVTNTWLGFPFMMVVCLGALQSIPRDLYEAAEVDGAGKWTMFRTITWPLIQPALLPAVILGSIWTFNMFNVIYLVSGGEPGGSTDILITEAYRWAFIRYERYGLAAAYATLIFVILIGYTYLTSRVTRKAREGAS